MSIESSLLIIVPLIVRGLLKNKIALVIEFANSSSSESYLYTKIEHYLKLLCGILKYFTLFKGSSISLKCYKLSKLIRVAFLKCMRNSLNSSKILLRNKGCCFSPIVYSWQKDFYDKINRQLLILFVLLKECKIFSVIKVVAFL